ncbi:fimbrial protein [Klebsiella aerogenes]|uniref:fimbrial protein n=1 Tax=Klebsiella aerogenes TaxID=548 RepID=UPI0007B3F94F|nr:fimbrial protein [Klebsiella aerogenes]EKZ5855733.1 fimbrial protein [Klebsiella aerogenes]EKZ6548494.1 fimbrial protein [Klebsiella aerogenes]EKZ6676771.1 fimbrial protein [Klebsiella aerogenes]KZR11333.1 hypothetical protein A3N65_12400 [Klebsiella aerogenes]
MFAGVGMLAVSAFAHADTTTSSTGTIEFNGSVVDTACAIDADSIDQTVALGEVRSASIATAGAASTHVPFSIQLDDCDSTEATTASFAFTGQTAGSDDTVLENLYSGSDGATGVGVQLVDASGATVPVDGSTSSTSALTVQDGTNIANFDAYMIATADGATAGSVHSTVTFQVTYQ